MNSLKKLTITSFFLFGFFLNACICLAAPPVTIPAKFRNSPPRIIKIQFPDNKTFLAGSTIKIRIIAFDANSDPLEYQFSIGGAVKQPWSSSNTYIWQTSAADTGASDILCEVRDNRGGAAATTISCQIINPTVEEILQKAADNYAKIYDFTADRTLSSTLDGKPFGQTQYCKYYFKAPNKEKTESFSDFHRNLKTDVIIIDGSTMHLIDPVQKITQDVDLLAEAGVDSAQFNQMDIYYNLPNFLEKHDVTINTNKTDFNNFIIVLNVTPKESNPLYSMLELSINYTKGLLIEFAQYKGNELPQILKVVQTRQMGNGVWMASKIQKLPNLTAGNLIVNINYSNIWLNAGLVDFDFDPAKQY